MWMGSPTRPQGYCNPSSLVKVQDLQCAHISPVSVDGGGVESGLRQVRSEEIGISLLTDEDEDSLAGNGAQHFHQLLPLVELSHLKDRLVHVGIGATNDAHSQEDVFLKVCDVGTDREVLHTMI